MERLDYPVIVVDDSSPDGTGIMAKNCGAMVITRPQKSGIASAYYEGLKAALELKPKYIVQMDAGLTHKPEDAGRLVEIAREGYGLVIGSRFMFHAPNTRRSMISKTAAKMFSLLNIPVHDATSGFRCWNAGLLERVIDRPFRAKHFAFQLETLYRADRLGARIAEVPIEYKLTNSSFRIFMLVEALKIYIGLWGQKK